MAAEPGIAAVPPVLTSGDIVAGLGDTPRELLAACLALFDDSTLQRRIGTLIKRWTSRVKKGAPNVTDEEAASAVQDSICAWNESPLSDDDLRVLVWMYLRDAFALAPLTFASMRSSDTAADDMVARALYSLQPSRVATLVDQLGVKKFKDPPPTTLDGLARKTMEELMESFLNAKDARSRQVREELLAETHARVAQLSAEDRDRLLRAVGADVVNDAALRRILLTGGGLGAFGASVSLAGFSAYILAAQASAFIPLVSGPALVSMVAVLSNPITIIAATAGIGWWTTRSANQKVRGAVGLRVLSLLALNGLQSGAAGRRAMVNAFDSLEGLERSGELPSTVLTAYQADWRLIAGARDNATKLDLQVSVLMERPEGLEGGAARTRALLDLGEHGSQHTVVLAGLTLGDILYNAYRVDPRVLEAADFSRVEDLGDRVAFAAFAHRIEGMEPAANLGAISNLKGYMAERVVAAQLASQGHVVEFPQSANEAGWDIAVDGVRFQVKDVADLSGLQRHFDRGYEYPVIANAELAQELASRPGEDLPEWADKVHFVEGYNNEVVEHVTRSSLEAGGGMLDPNVPLFTLVLSGIRNVSRVNRDEITRTQAVQEVLLDGGTRAGLAVVGNYVGVGVGLLAFGPAGALVLGAVVPIISQGQSWRLKGKLDDWVQDETYIAWADKARHARLKLLERVEDALLQKAAVLRDRDLDEADAVVVRYLRWRVADELSFLREVTCRLSSIRDDKNASIESSTAKTLTWLSTSTLHPATYQTELAALSKIFDERPSAADRLTTWGGGIPGQDGPSRRCGDGGRQEMGKEFGRKKRWLTNS